jgi:hypothetical protein
MRQLAAQFHGMLRKVGRRIAHGSFCRNSPA